MHVIEQMSFNFESTFGSIGLCNPIEGFTGEITTLRTARRFLNNVSDGILQTRLGNFTRETNIVENTASVSQKFGGLITPKILQSGKSRESSISNLRLSIRITQPSITETTKKKFWHSGINSKHPIWTSRGQKAGLEIENMPLRGILVFWRSKYVAGFIMLLRRIVALHLPRYFLDVQSKSSNHTLSLNSS